jgi:ketosteroid isomerase-like protein
MTISRDMTDLMAALYDSFTTGDAAVWEAALGDDAQVIGTDEGEWWVGRDTAMAAIRTQLAEMGSAGIRLEAGDPTVVERGDAVWLADRATLYLPDGSSQVVRLTVGASVVDGRLAIHQMHLSAPAPNEELIHQSLTV